MLRPALTTGQTSCRVSHLVLTIIHAARARRRASEVTTLRKLRRYRNLNIIIISIIRPKACMLYRPAIFSNSVRLACCCQLPGQHFCRPARRRDCTNRRAGTKNKLGQTRCIRKRRREEYGDGVSHFPSPSD